MSAISVRGLHWLKAEGLYSNLVSLQKRSIRSSTEDSDGTESWSASRVVCAYAWYPHCHMPTVWAFISWPGEATMSWLGTRTYFRNYWFSNNAFGIILRGGEVLFNSGTFVCTFYIMCCWIVNYCNLFAYYFT